MRRMRRPASASYANPVLRGAIRRLIDPRHLTASMLAGSLLLVSTQPASALAIGELNLHSRLGQRLSATLPVRLDAGEALRDGCVLPDFVSSGLPGSGLASVPGVAVEAPEATSAGAYELKVGSTEPLYEPMYALTLRINCPGVPTMVRQFVLMLDLPGVAAATGSASPTATVAPIRLPAASGAAATTMGTQAIAPAQPRAATAPIPAGSRYHVTQGDTLSSIAARVRDRGVSLWAFAKAIQAANPAAFIHGDPNLIKLGSEITIPAPMARAADSPATHAPAPAPVAMPTVQTPAAPAATTPVAAVPTTAVEAPTIAPAITAPPEQAIAEQPATSPTNTSTAPSIANAMPAAAEATRVAPAADPAVDAQPNPFLAAGAGIIFGLLVSVLLWLRARLPARHKPATIHTGSVTPAAAGLAATGSFGTIPVAINPRDEEPGLTVSWSEGPVDDALAAEFADAPATTSGHPVAGDTDPGHLLADTDSAGGYTPAPAGDDITSELEELFDSTDTTIQKRLEAEKLAAVRAAAENEPTVAVDALEQPDDLFNIGRTDGSLAGSTVDFLIGELRAADEAADNATVEQPRPAPGSQPASEETVDIHALSAQISAKNPQAQTLVEALSLLERDYENELTASQVMDLSAVRDALGGDDEPTQIRETQISDRRRKAR